MAANLVGAPRLQRSLQVAKALVLGEQAEMRDGPLATQALVDAEALLGGLARSEGVVAPRQVVATE